MVRAALPWHSCSRCWISMATRFTAHWAFFWAACSACVPWADRTAGTGAHSHARSPPSPSTGPIASCALGEPGASRLGRAPGQQMLDWREQCHPPDVPVVQGSLLPAKSTTFPACPAAALTNPASHCSPLCPFLSSLCLSPWRLSALGTYKWGYKFLSPYPTPHDLCSVTCHPSSSL